MPTVLYFVAELDGEPLLDFLDGLGVLGAARGRLDLVAWEGGEAVRTAVAGAVDGEGLAALGWQEEPGTPAWLFPLPPARGGPGTD